MLVNTETICEMRKVVTMMERTSTIKDKVWAAANVDTKKVSELEGRRTVKECSNVLFIDLK